VDARVLGARGEAARALAVGAAIVVAAAVAVAIDEPPAPPARAPDGSVVLFADSFDDDDWCEYHRVQNRYFSDPACDYDNDSYGST
jgi:hypothetical protein